MSKKKEILKDAGIYSLSSYAAQFFDVLTGILLRRFLGPAQMGVWAFLQVIINYAKHASLGITTATTRDVPYYLKKGETEKAEETKNLVFSFTVLTAGLTSLGVVVFALAKRNTYSSEIFIGLLVVAGIILLQRIYNLYVVLLRAHKAFVFAGLLNFFSSVLGLVLALGMAWPFKLFGFFASVLLNYLLCLAILHWKTPYRFSFLFSWKKILPLFDLGFAMLVSDVLRTFLTSADRIMIAKFLSFEQLGIYSVALMANNYLYSLPNMFGVILFPHFQELYAQRDNPQDLVKYLVKPALGLAFLFPLPLAVVWIFSNWLVPAFLPAYRDGLGALEMVILGSFFMALTHPFSNFLITVRKHWLLIPLQILLIASAYGFSGWFLHAGRGIEGVAIASLITAFLNFIFFSAASFKILKLRQGVLMFYVQVVLSFVYTLAALLAVAWITRGLEETHLGTAFLQTLLFAGFALPLLALAERETGILRHAWEMLTGFFAKKASKDLSSGNSSNEG